MPSRAWTFGRRGGRTNLIAIGALSVATLLGGCSTNGARVSDESVTSAERIPTRTVTQQAEPFRTLGYSLSWSIGDVGGSASRTRMLDVADDLILVHDVSNNLVARELSNGQSRWAANLGNPLTKFVGNVRINDRIIAASETELLILDTATGRLDDRQRLAVLANTAPAVANDYMLIFGTATGEVFGHDLRNGFRRWGFALNQRLRGKPVIIGQVAGAVAESGQVLIVNPLNGEAVSRLGQIYGGLDNNPVSDGRNMYIASVDQSIYAYSGSTGELLWRVRTQSRLAAQPTVHDGTLYQYVPGEGMLAIATRNGSRQWENPEVDGEVIAIRRGNLVVWNGSEAMLVDPATGDVRERVALPGVRLIRTKGFVDGELVVVFGSSSLSRFVSR